MINRSKLIGLEGINFVLKPLHTSLVSLAVVRFFNLELWGALVAYLVVVELASNLLNWGQKPYLIRSFSLSPNSINKNWYEVIYSRFPLLFLVGITFFLLPEFRNYSAYLIIWVACKWFSQLFEPYLQYNRKYSWSIVAEFAAIVTAMGILFLKPTIDLESLILIFACSSIVRFLFLLPLFPIKELPSFSLKKMKSQLFASFPFFALSIAGLIQTKGDLYVSAYLMNDMDLATYQVIIGFLLIGQAISWIVLGPFQKNIFRWQGKDIRKLKSLYLKIGISISSVFTLLLYFAITYIYLIKIELVLLIYFFIYLIVLYFYLIESQILLKNKKEKELLNFTLLAAGSNLFLSFVFIPFLGLKGALIGGIVGKVVLAILVVNKYKKLT
ncbi:MAG: polysaccharide biosynthesis C-terminal domain-containing protein [Vicingaceae bacterium]